MTHPAGGTLPDIATTILDNGIRVLTQEIPGVQTAGIGIRVESGARNEPPELYGAAHYLEHLLFKGTSRRSAAEINRAFDALGAEVNACTGMENVTYFATCLGGQAKMVLPLLAEMYCDSVFPADEVETERKVVLEEIGKYEDNPSTALFYALRAGLWDGGPLAHHPLGSRETIQPMSRDQLLNFFHEQYTAANTLVIATGNVSHQAVVDLAAQHFAGIAARPRPATIPLHEAWRPRLGVRRHHTRDMAQVQLYMAYRGVPGSDRQRTRLELMNQILGGSMGSLLFEEVRERRGLAYSVSSFEMAASDEAALIIGLGTGPATAAEAVEVCHDLVTGLARACVSEQQLADAKRLATSRILLELDDQQSQITSLAELHQRYGRAVTAAERLAELEKVTAEDVRAAAAALVSGGEPRVESIGPGASIG